MGTPTQQNWSEGLKLAQAMNFRFPQFAPTPLSKIIPHACPEAIDLLNCMLHWDPNKRLTAVQCLQVRMCIIMPQEIICIGRALEGGG